MVSVVATELVMALPKLGSGDSLEIRQFMVRLSDFTLGLLGYR